MNKKLIMVLDQSHINKEIIEDYFKNDDWLCFIENNDKEISQFFKVKFVYNSNNEYFLSKVFVEYTSANKNWLFRGFSNTDDQSNKIFQCC